MIKFLFDRFDKLNQVLENKIAEISVKQSRITFDFEDQSILPMSDLKKINESSGAFSVSEVAAFQDRLFVIFDELDEGDYEPEFEKPLGCIYSFIFTLREKLCTCPMLEFQIAKNYIKIYIDVPNVYVQNLAEIEEIMHAKGTVESNGQRNYLLYVRDW